MKRNILVAHGGGPTTVINASLFGVIDEAMRQSSSGKVFGAIHGVEGVLCLAINWRATATICCS